MPVYEYICTKCEHHLEKFQKASEPDPSECPECGEHGLQRQISAAAFSLKGTGWYVTDFKPDKSSKASMKQGQNDGDKAEAGKDSKADGGRDNKADGGRDNKADSGRDNKADSGRDKAKSKSDSSPGDSGGKSTSSNKKDG